MINLLPPKEKRTLRREYMTRVAVVAMLFALATEILFAVMFLPTAYSLSLSTQSLSDELARTQNSLPKDILDIQAEVEDLNSDVSTLKNTGDLMPTKYLDALGRAKTPGISLSSIMFEKNPPPALVLSGYAATRADLTIFRNALRKDPLFSGADFDAQLLLQESGIPFTGMRATLKI